MTNETSALSAAELEKLQSDKNALTVDLMFYEGEIASLRQQLAEAQEREAQMLRQINGLLDETRPASPSPVLRDAVIEDDATVEKVARAIIEAASGPWEFMSGQGKDAARREARAAIRALASRPVSEREGSADTAPAPAEAQLAEAGRLAATIANGWDRTAPAPAISDEGVDWLWYDHASGLLSFGRWPKLGVQRKYVPAPAISGGDVLFVRTLRRISYAYKDSFMTKADVCRLADDALAAAERSAS